MANKISFNPTALKYHALEFEKAFFDDTKIKFAFRVDLRTAVFEFTEDQLVNLSRAFNTALNEGRTLSDLREVFMNMLGIKLHPVPGARRSDALTVVEFYWPDGRPAHSSSLIRSLVRHPDNHEEILLDTLAYYMGRRTGAGVKSRMALRALEAHKKAEGISHVFILKALHWSKEEVEAFYNKYLPNGLWRKAQ